MSRILTNLFLITLFVAQNVPQVNQGLLDLRAVSFEEKPIALHGDWYFLWNRLVSEIPDSTSSFIPVPSGWETQKYSVNGFATYGLRIFLPETKEPLGLKLIYINTAYRVFANGNEIVSSGTVGTSLQSSIPQQTPRVVYFSTQRDTLDLVIQVSNYHYRKAGLIREIYLGSASVVQKARELNIAFDLFLFGVLVLFGIYHFSLFALRKQEKSNLYFALFCLIISTRSLLIEERFIMSVFPDLPWHLTIQAIFIGIYLSLPLFMAFTLYLYPDEISRFKVKLNVFISAFCIVLTLVSNAMFFSDVFQIYQFVVMYYGLYVISAIYKAVRHKRTGAIYSMAGFVIFYSTVLVAILYENGLGGIPSLLPVGFVLFVFSQSYNVSLRFSKAFEHVEVLLKEEEKISNENKQLYTDLQKVNLQLEGYTKDLEYRIEERTLEFKEAKRIAELANQAKSRYLAFITHELRTPITAVTGYAEFLKMQLVNEYPDSHMLQDVTKLLVASKHLVQLINNVLDLSKIEAGKMEVYPYEFNIESVLLEVKMTVEPLIKNHHNTLEFYVNLAIKKMESDQVKLKQILLNILGNATKFTQNGEITLTATTSKTDLILVISDTGKGMTTDQVSQLFESYSQFHNEEKESIQGTGLGMAICKEFTDVLQGTIEVRSVVGEGSTFTLALPLQMKMEENVAGPTKMKAFTPEAK